MKQKLLQKTMRLKSIGVPSGLVLVLASCFLEQNAGAAVLTVDLAGASEFAALAGAGITVAGAVNTTTITGDIGSFAITSITGLENVVLNGVNHAGDAVTQQGKLDLGLAYVDAAGRLPTETFPPIAELGGLILGSGVYNDPSSFSITGILTLDAGGDPDAVWIFQSGSTLITASGSNILLIGSARASNVFWQVGSAATLGTNSHFEGSILASDSISLNTGASLNGRALAMTGAVTFDYNIIQIPEPGSTLLFGAGLVLLAMRRQRIHPRASLAFHM